MNLKIGDRQLHLDPVDHRLPRWTVLENGVDRTDEVNDLAIFNEGLGTAVLYGKHPSLAWNQATFYNRGGAVIIPYVIYEGTLYVAVNERH
ncbi:MAG: hypothetical protein M3Q29_19120 [Chloroflexota bacterium]|nr:hypothetical protein [Chloroflexota bacterium]